MKRPEIVLIAAVAEENRVIGKEGKLPWHIKEDLQHFKRLTTGRPLLMGRKTFESIIEDFGGPLPNRRNIVLTRRGKLPDYPFIETYASLDLALNALSDEPVVFIGGGQHVYEQTLPLADRLELTLIEGSYEGDTFFPPFEHLIGTTFECVKEVPRTGYRFVTLVRKVPITVLEAT